MTIVFEKLRKNKPFWQRKETLKNSEFPQDHQIANPVFSNFRAPLGISLGKKP